VSAPTFWEYLALASDDLVARGVPRREVVARRFALTGHVRPIGLRGVVALSAHAWRSPSNDGPLSWRARQDGGLRGMGTVIDSSTAEFDGLRHGQADDGDG